MGLLQDICAEINEYKAFVATLADKADRIQEELAGEKRLGLFEMDPYNSTGKAAALTGAEPARDVVDFVDPGHVERPVQHPNANKQPTQRLAAVYDPAKGRVIDVLKANPQGRPEGDFIEANADQFDVALKHLNKINPKLADMLMSGAISVWIPRGQHIPQHSSMLSQPQGTGTRRVELDPKRLAAAQQAAAQMTLAK